MKMRYLVGLGMAAGLLASGLPAHAEGANVNVPASNMLASGSYNVVLNRTSPTTFSVFVKGNNDGRTTATGPLEPAKHSIGRISIGFIGQSGTFIQPSLVGSFGASTTGGGFVGSPYQVTLDGDVVRFNAPLAQNDVGPFGENQFTGQAALTSADPIRFFTIALQNGTQQWSAVAPAGVIPEPGSLALILPGLLPLGFALMRRRGLRGSQSEDTGADLPETA